MTGSIAASYAIDDKFFELQKSIVICKDNNKLYGGFVGYEAAKEVFFKVMEKARKTTAPVENISPNIISLSSALFNLMLLTSKPTANNFQRLILHSQPLVLYQQKLNEKVGMAYSATGDQQPSSAYHQLSVSMGKEAFTYGGDNSTMHTPLLSPNANINDFD